MFHFSGRAGRPRPAGAARPEAAPYPNFQTFELSHFHIYTFSHLHIFTLSHYRTVITAPAFTRPVVCAPFSANGVPALG